MRTFAQLHGGARHVQFQAVVGLVQGLPDAVQVGLAVGEPVRLEVLGRERRHRHGENRDHSHGNCHPSGR